MSDLSEARLKEALKGSPLGVPFRYLELTGSTNDDALAWAGENAPHGALIVAEAQTQGRGRRGKGWAGGSGLGLLFTLILRPRLPRSRLGLLGGALCIALAQAVRRETSLPAQTKWPNDLWIRERKVAGTLIETIWQGDSLQAAVGGVGLNVNQAASDLPETPDYPAASLAMLGGRSWDRRDLLLRFLEETYVRLRRAETEPGRLLAEWESLEMTLGREIEVVRADRSQIGKATGLSPDGGLRVKIDGGERLLRWGESSIRFIRDSTQHSTETDANGAGGQVEGLDADRGSKASERDGGIIEGTAA
jgi:BirA family biotin operon repressor/biotin-[acetyl-CoA-carboxylase] ligase